MRNVTSYVLAAAALTLPIMQAPAAQAAVPTAALTQSFNSCGYHPTEALRLRTGPGKTYTTIGMLYPDDDVTADKAKGGWYRVSLQDRSKSGLKSGTTGWVAKFGLKPHVCMQLN
ncbi:SH3 domain-containing protein [Streptomyces sp. NPDC000229]|uniref:SH3 domain-containing protein n=1 Tax=Streptomyces sp. NPDC000229 TaxID=3154247 RepID=UPI003320FD13